MIPKWIEEYGKWNDPRMNKLIEALSIAWKALESAEKAYLGYQWEPEDYWKSAKEALRRIEEVGK